MEVPSIDDNSPASVLLKRAERFTANRGTWDSYWSQLALFFIPRRNDVYGQLTAGSVVEDYLYDSTSVHAVETLASSLHAMLSNPATKWFGFTSGDPEYDRTAEFTKWNQQTVNKISHIFSSSNFHTQAADFYLDIAAFGTAVMSVEADDVDVVRFTSRPIYDYMVAENASSQIDTIYRWYEYTCKQLIEKFPEHFAENAKDKVFKQKMLEQYNSDPAKSYRVLHAVEPRSVHKRLDPIFSSNKPFRSAYVLEEGAFMLKDSGFDENPYVVARWSKLSSEMYGRSPAMKALPHVKTLNMLMKVVLQAAQLAVAPPLQAPDEGVLLPLDDSPHAINFYRAGSKDRIEPINIQARPDIGIDLIKDIREEVRNCFFVNQLQLAEQGPRMTATEVLQRTEEKLRLLSPILGRLTYEWLNPIVSKTMTILIKKDIIDPPPGDTISVRFTSQVAKSQKSIEADNFSKFLATIAPIAEQQPDIFQHFDPAGIVNVLADVFGVHHEMLKDPEVLKEEQAQQAQQQQQQALMENAGSLSQAVKNVGV